MHYSYYNRGYTIKSGNAAALNYTINKKNLFWPVPNGAITANKDGRLWQNYGYDGYDEQTPVWDSWQEAVADEDIVGR